MNGHRATSKAVLGLRAEGWPSPILDPSPPIPPHGLPALSGEAGTRARCCSHARSGQADVSAVRFRSADTGEGTEVPPGPARAQGRREAVGRVRKPRRACPSAVGMFWFRVELWSGLEGLAARDDQSQGPQLRSPAE